MPLVRELRKTGSPIRNFLLTKFSNTRGFLADARKQVRESDVIRPSDDVPRDYHGTIGTALDYRIRYYFGITPNHELVAYKGARLLTDEQEASSSIQLGFDQSDDSITIFDKNSGKKIFMYFIQHSGGVGMGNLDEATVSEASDFAYRVATGEISASERSDLPLKSEHGDFFDCLDSWLNLNPTVGTKLAKSQEDEINRFCIVLAMMEVPYRSPVAEVSQLETSNSLLGYTRFPLD